MHMRILFDINHSALPRYLGGEYHSCPQPPFFRKRVRAILRASVRAII